MVTSLEILDTAVKVGLGALITAGSGYVLARLNHTREAEKERIRRRRELLEKIAEQVETFSHAALRYWALVTEWARYEEREKDMPEDRLTMAEDARLELFNAFRELTSAEAKLLLLGENTAQTLLRDYGEGVRSMARDGYIGKQRLSEKQMVEHRTAFLANRAALFTKLSEVYRRVEA
jgi:hypothetical protein